jgi:hypothetical protein
MNKLSLAAVFLTCAVSAQSQELPDAYREALKESRRQAESLKQRQALDSVLRSAGAVPDILNDYDGDSYGTRYSISIVPQGEYKAPFVSTLNVDLRSSDVVSVDFLNHPLFDGTHLAWYPTIADFQKAAAPAIAAFAQDAIASYPYVTSIPAFVDPKAAAQMKDAMAAARACDAEISALETDLAAMGMTTGPGKDAAFEAKKHQIVIRVQRTLKQVTSVGITFEDSATGTIRHLGSYETIAALRKATGNLAQVRAMIKTAEPR